MISIILVALILGAATAYAEPIDADTLAAVLDIARTEGVPVSVAYWLQIEESGDRHSGTCGRADAINEESGGWPSVGLYQINTRPDNLSYLLAAYWHGRGEVVPFDPFDSIHSAKLGLRYLADLHRQLGTWYKAACAYNAGASKVRSGEVDTLAKYADTRAYARRIVEAREPVPRNRIKS